MDDAQTRQVAELRTACWVSENTPVIIAWDAMMVAAVAMMTTGMSTGLGTRLKKW